MDWMLMPYRRYVDFSGRSQRKEYWMFQLLVFIVYFVASLLITMGAPSVDPATGQMSGGSALATLGTAILGIFWLGTIIPALAVAIRRMHDQDRSGWWILCPIANIIFLFIDGTPGTNRFGPDPKGRGA
jgi:uncharacterized membrane protein YhaH (DUF805 family)